MTLGKPDAVKPPVRFDEGRSETVIGLVPLQPVSSAYSTAAHVMPIKHQCPCCDYFTLEERGRYDICPVCFWEDSGQDLDRIDEHSGPNHQTLREGRAHFAEFGACDRAMLAHIFTHN